MPISDETIRALALANASLRRAGITEGLGLWPLDEMTRPIDGLVVSVAVAPPPFPSWKRPLRWLRDLLTGIVE